MAMMMQRSIAQSTYILRSAGRSATVLRHLSAASAPSIVKNSHYNVEEFHRREVLEAIRTDESFRNSLSYSLSMAASEGSKFPPLTGEMSPTMKDQLETSKHQLYNSTSNKNEQQILESIDERPLPRTLEDALRPTSRAIVITEVTRPFRVCDVNKAWENLCGYSYVESQGKSLGELLKGPETDPLAVTSLISQLLRGEDATTVLTNYTKSGRKFRNRLHVGPLYDENGQVSNFVGVLQEVRM